VIAQVNTNTLESLFKNTGVMTSAQINVGRLPVSINSYSEGDIYVANSDSNTVSVIDPITNTVVKDIVVGQDRSIAALHRYE
jgi:YVTN family beta-propeller protein